MKKTRHVLGLSGGKDSAALALHVDDKYPDIPIEYFFTDTGYELEETYDFLNKLKTRLKKPIHYIKPIISSQYPTKALRPSYSVLESNLTKKILELKKLNWRDALIQEFYP